MVFSFVRFEFAFVACDFLLSLRRQQQDLYDVRAQIVVLRLLQLGLDNNMPASGNYYAVASFVLNGLLAKRGTLLSCCSTGAGFERRLSYNMSMVLLLLVFLCRAADRQSADRVRS